MANQFQKHYTRDEARFLLPQVRQWLTRSGELQAEVQKIEERLSGLMAPGCDLGGELVNTWVRRLVDLEGCCWNSIGGRSRSRILSAG